MTSDTTATRHRAPARWLVPAQMTAVAAHLVPGGPRLPAVLRSPGLRAAGAAAAVAGGGLAAASAVSLGRHLTPSVVPREGAELRTTGVYALSRHPLYAGLLLCSAGTVLLRGRATTALASLVLAVVLHVKAGAEDTVLADTFGEQHRAYRARVPRLVGLPRGSGRRRLA